MKVSIVIFLVLLISACKDEEKNQKQNISEPVKATAVVKQQTSKAETELIKKEDDSEKVVDFSYKDLDDKDVKLSDFRGKWVVVNYWATWCPPCRKEIPDFVKFKSLYSNKVEILGINNEDAETDVIKTFAEKYAFNYPILRADVYNPTDFDRENTMGLPTTVIFNPKGQQTSKRVGPIHFKDLVEIIGVEPNTPIKKDSAEKE